MKISCSGTRNSNIKYYVLFFIFSFCVLFDAGDLSSAGRDKASDIAYKVSKRETGKDQKNILTMKLINNRGQIRTRKVEWSIKDSPSGKKKFIRFIEPADVAGTTFLSIEHKGGDEEQRLYLPTLRRVRRISSSKKDSAFMGTDMTYEDLEEKNFEDYTYEFVKNEKVSGVDCSVIKYLPKKKSQYSHMLLYIDTSRYIALQIDFFDKRGKQIKTMKNENIQKIKGIWVPKKIYMVNYKEQHQTIMLLDKVSINTGIPNSVFTVQNMKR